jgi:tetratricopeptide (TPR) repeat protein
MQVLGTRVVVLGCAAALLVGCQAPRGQSGVADRSFRNWFRPSASELAAKRAREAEVADPPRRIDDPTELSLAYARWMEDVNNLGEARRHYSEVAETKPKNVEALLGLARIDQASGMTYEAEQGFQKALRLSPNSPLALHALGQFYASQQRWPEAVDALNKAMLAAPVERQYRYDLAVAMVQSGDVNAAMPHFIRTVGDAEAHYNVGLILQQQGRLADAEQQMLLAVTKKPDLHEAQYWLDEIRRQSEADQIAQSPVQRAAHQFTAPPSQGSFPPPTAPPVVASPAPQPTAPLNPQQQQQMRNQYPPSW